ncbi:hypothetical protein ACFE04_024151 [Oxalis oulophora]
MSLFNKSQLQLHTLLKSHTRPSLILTKTLTSSSTQIDPDLETKTPEKKPLLQFFKQVIGIEQVPDNSPDSNYYSDHKLAALERQLRILKSQDTVKTKPNPKAQKKKKKDEEKPKTAANQLSNLFRSGKKDSNVKEIKEEVVVVPESEVWDDEVAASESETEPQPRVFKDLTPDMVAFLRFLHVEGYFKKANFLPKGKLEFGCFQDAYARNFIMSAAREFGKDHQDIAKWLSGSDLKKVAQFGCPSTARKAVFSAKSLRFYFKIPENDVCGKCLLKDSCNFVNQSVWKDDNKILNLATVMRMIILYAMEEVPTKLAVPDDVKNSVNSLLKDVINLSQAEASSEAV